MSGTPHIKSLGVAAETSFLSIDPTTGLPDASGLPFVSIACLRANFHVAGEAPVDPREDTRSQPGEYPPEPNTACVNGTSQPRRSGTLTVEMTMPNVGNRTEYATIDDLPQSLLLNSVMSLTQAPGANADISGGAGVSGNSWPPGALANYVSGGIVGANLNGVGEYTAITDTTGPNVTASPALSVTPPAGTEFRIGHTYSAQNVMRPLGPSLAFRGDGDGWRWYGVGSRVSEIAISTTPHLVYFTFTVQLTHVYDDNSAPDVIAGTNIVEPKEPDGCPAHMLQCRTVVSDVAVNKVAAPMATGSEALLVDTFEATLTFTLGSKGTSDNIAGVADLEVTNIVGVVTLYTSDPISAVNQSTFYARQLHSLMVGLSQIGEGEGMALYIPAAALFNDPNVLDADADIQRNRYEFHVGTPYNGDTPTAPPPSPDPSSTVLRLTFLN